MSLTLTIRWPASLPSMYVCRESLGSGRGSFRRHCRWWRPRRHRSSSRRCTRGSNCCAGYEFARNHRADVVQSGDRRSRQGYGSPRGGCPRRHHGPGDRPCFTSVQNAQPQQGSRCVGATCSVRSRSLSQSCAIADRGSPSTPDHSGNCPPAVDERRQATWKESRLSKEGFFRAVAW